MWVVEIFISLRKGFSENVCNEYWYSWKGTKNTRIAKYVNINPFRKIMCRMSDHSILSSFYALHFKLNPTRTYYWSNAFMNLLSKSLFTPIRFSFISKYSNHQNILEAWYKFLCCCSPNLAVKLNQKITFNLTFFH